ncbi:MAG TPA: hypothetical protein VFN26_16865 [Candidatus Acidoferrum sp.]|nr:hypothetical protein [Candidatus Acidoferrum sp.]
MKIWLDVRKSLLMATGLVAIAAFVADARPRQGRGAGTPIYDPKTETTISGVIQEVKEVPGPGRGTGTHLIVKAGGDIHEVHVGPTWYLARQKYAFAKGDSLEVTGSNVKYHGADAIVARQIKKDGHTWTLRDEQGVPAWSRGKNR